MIGKTTVLYIIYIYNMLCLWNEYLVILFKAPVGTHLSVSVLNFTAKILACVMQLAKMGKAGEEHASPN